MPEGQVIGRVSVRVLPDTSDFRRRANQQLNAVEKQLSEVMVQTRANLDGAVRDMLEGIRRINAENRAMDSRKIRFHATFARSSMDEEITKAIRALEAKAANRKVKLSADLVAGTAQLDLDQQALDRVRRQLDDWRSENDPIKVYVRPELATGFTTAINQRLNYIARPRSVPLIPHLDNTAVAKVATALAALSGARVLTGWFRTLGRVLGNLDKSVPVIGSIAVAVAGLGASGIAATSNLAALSASLASIAGSALALPGILGGLALGIGVTVIAFKDAGKVLPDVKQRFTELRDAISSNFWAAAEQPIRRLVDGLLPQFSAGIRTAATDIGEFFGSFADKLNGSLDGALAGMFADLSKSIDIATGSTADLANIITVLGKTGAGYLPRLAKWFVDIADRFNAWLSTAAADGRLTGWIDAGIIALKNFWTVLTSVWDILGGVATAAEAAGGSVLASLAASLAHVAKVVNSPGFQSGLIGVFSAAHTAMQLIADISGPAVQALFTELASTLKTILPSVGVTIGNLLNGVASALAQPAFQGGLVAMFRGIEQAVTALAPAFGPVGVALGDLAGLVGTFAATLGPLAATAFTAIAKALSAISPVLQQLIPMLGGALLAAFTALSPVIAQVTSAIAGLVTGGLIPALTTAFGSLGPTVGTLVPLIGQVLATAIAALTPILTAIGALLAQIAPVIAQFATAILPVLMPLLTAVGTALGAIITALAPLVGALLNLLTSILIPIAQAVMSVVTEALPGLQAAFTRLAEAVMPLIVALQAVVDFLMPVLAPAVKFVAKVLVDSLIAAIEGVAKVFTGVVNVIKGLWNILAGIFTGDWPRVWEGVKQVFLGIWDAIVGAFQVILNVGILGVAKKALAAVKEAWTAAWNAVKSAATAVWNGLKAAFDALLGGLKSAASGGLSAIKGFFSSAWDNIKAACATAWNAIKSAVTEGIGKVVSTVKELPGKAKSALGNIGSVLVDAGKQLIQGFINGIKGMFGAVKNKLGELTSKLTSWKGPAPRDRVLLYGAGRLVIDGFISGLESRYAAVRKSLAGLTEDVGKTAITVPAVPPAHARRASTELTAALADRTAGDGPVTKVLNYYAAPGASLSSEEDLFKAASRARMVGW